MRIFITGGTGLIGSSLIKELSKEEHQITVLTRDEVRAGKKLGNEISYCTNLDGLDTLDGFDAVVNLAGEPIVGRRWSDKQKERLCESRWSITYRLSELINKSSNPPRVFISGSAVGYYGSQDDRILTEESGSHDEFIHQLCYKWEQLALYAKSERTRVCILRTGIVLSKDGGMLPMMVLPFRFGLGSIFGKGSQYISWIHIRDMVSGILFLLSTLDAEGIFNLTAPSPETNKIFSKKLASAMSRPCMFRLPNIILKTFLGEMATMVVDGQRVFPDNLIKHGFNFKYDNLENAFGDIFS